MNDPTGTLEPPPTPKGLSGLHVSGERSTDGRFQRHSLWPIAAAVPLVIALAVLGLGFGNNIALLLREPTATAQLHPLTGFVSNLGVLLWCTTSSICIFAGLLVRRYNDSSGTASLLLSAGCLSGYLMLDDLFQIHEDLAARYFGVGEMYVYAAMGLAASWYLIRHRRLIFHTDIRLLALAIAFFSVSVAIDALFEPWLHGFGQGRILLEDGTKWLGICAWCSYHVQVAFASVLRSRAHEPAAESNSTRPSFEQRPAEPVC